MRVDEEFGATAVPPLAALYLLATLQLPGGRNTLSMVPHEDELIDFTARPFIHLCKLWNWKRQEQINC